MGIRARIYGIVCSLFLEDPEATLTKLSNIINLRGKTICEIGGGTGRLLKPSLIKKVKRYYFVEPESAYMDLARMKTGHRKNISFIGAKGEQTDKMLKKGSVDAVLFVDSFHHMEKDAQVKTLNACHKVLKRKGKIILVEFDNDKFLGKIVKLTEKAFGEPGTFYSPSKLRNFLKQLGFKEIIVTNQGYAKLFPQFYIYASA